MADIFTKRDVEKLLREKNVWFFGDSNVRGIYKDLVWLLEKNTLIDLNSLKSKLEGSFMNDVLIKGGSLHRGRNFQEIRQYKNFKVKANVEFTFLTQCYSKEIQDRLKAAVGKKELPDVVVINSCVWDITRWGPESVGKYKANIASLIKFLKGSLPARTKVIWITTPPISQEPRGGFFIKQIDFLKHTLRFDVMEANAFVSREFILHGYDVLDIHYHLLLQIHRRRPDGIHWSPEAVRHITNLLLTHMCISWNSPLPGNFKSPLLDKLRPPNGKIICDAKPTELQDPPNADTKIPELLKMLQSTKSKSRRKRGKKRDWNGNLVRQNSRNDYFANDVFNYDYKRKRFRVAGKRNW